MLAVIQYNKASTKIFLEYADYADVFSPHFVMKLPENTGIIKHVIELDIGKRLLYDPISSLGLMKLKTLKAYIETY